MKGVTRLICLAVLVSLFSACGGGGGSPAGGNNNSNTNNGAAALAKFGRDSFMPVVDNATWTYNFGSSVKISNIDTAAGTFEIVNTSGGSGWIKYTAEQDATGAHIGSPNGNSPNFLPHRWDMGFTPLIYEDSKLALGFKWDSVIGSNGLPTTSSLEITSMDVNIVTPGGQTYDHCIEIQRTTTYDPSETGLRVLSGKYYLKRGVGFVEAIRTWSSDNSWSVGNVETIYVTSYNIP